MHRNHNNETELYIKPIALPRRATICEPLQYEIVTVLYDINMFNKTNVNRMPYVSLTISQEP